MRENGAQDMIDLERPRERIAYITKHIKKETLPEIAHWGYMQPTKRGWMEVQ